MPSEIECAHCVREDCREYGCAADCEAKPWVKSRDGLSATLESGEYRVVAWCFGGWDIFRGEDIAIAGPALPLLGATLDSAMKSATRAFNAMERP